MIFSLSDIKFSPLTIINLFKSAFALKEEQQLIRVKGIFKKTGIKNYRGVFYNRIKDEDSDQLITLVTPADVHEKLGDGKMIEFIGYIGFQVENTGKIDVSVRITELISEQSISFSDDEQRKIDLLRKKYEMGLKDMGGFIRAKIRKQESIAIKVITGKSPNAAEDIKAAMGDAYRKYKIRFQEISIESKSQIIYALNQQHHVDIICISRGGGENLQIFDDIDICEKILSSEIIIASAIGHAPDVSLFDKLADKSFPTPSGFGHYLKDIFTRMQEEIPTNNPVRAEILKLEKQVELMRVSDSRKDRFLIACVVLLLLLVTRILFQ